MVLAAAVGDIFREGGAFMRGRIFGEAGEANEEEGFQSQREKKSAHFFWLSTTSGSSLS